VPKNTIKHYVTLDRYNKDFLKANNTDAPVSFQVVLGDVYKNQLKRNLCRIVADPGSAAFLTPNPGKVSSGFRISDPRSQTYMESLTIFGAKVLLILCKLAQIFSSPVQK
jgi:hypothetical protein